MTSTPSLTVNQPLSIRGIQTPTWISPSLKYASTKRSTPPTDSQRRCKLSAASRPQISNLDPQHERSPHALTTTISRSGLPRHKASNQASKGCRKTSERLDLQRQSHEVKTLSPGYPAATPAITVIQKKPRACITARDFFLF